MATQKWAARTWTCPRIHVDSTSDGGFLPINPWLQLRGKMSMVGGPDLTLLFKTHWRRQAKMRLLSPQVERFPGVACSIRLSG